MSSRNNALIVEAEILPPITTVYDQLADAIAATIAHPDVAGNIEMYLSEFADKIGAAATGNPAALNAPCLNSHFVRQKLPLLLDAAHNRVAAEQGLPMAA